MTGLNYTVLLLWTSLLQMEIPNPPHPFTTLIPTGLIPMPMLSEQWGTLYRITTRKTIVPANMFLCTFTFRITMWACICLLNIHNLSPLYMHNCYTFSLRICRSVSHLVHTYNYVTHRLYRIISCWRKKPLPPKMSNYLVLFFISLYQL